MKLLSRLIHAALALAAVSAFAEHGPGTARIADGGSREDIPLSCLNVPASFDTLRVLVDNPSLAQDLLKAGNQITKATRELIGRGKTRYWITVQGTGRIGGKLLSITQTVDGGETSYSDGRLYNLR